MAGRKALLTLVGLLVLSSCFVGGWTIADCSESQIRVFNYYNDKIVSPQPVFVGSNSQGIINRLSDGHFIYSEDGGANWEENGRAKINGRPVVSATGRNVAMVSGDDIRNIYTATFQEHNPYDGKLSELNTVVLPFLINYFVPHPLENDWLLASGSSVECTGGNNVVGCRRGAYFSPDFGRSWVRLVDYTGNNVDWAVKVGGPIDKAITEDYEDKTYQPSRPAGSKRLISINLEPLISGGLNTPVPAPHVLMNGIFESLLHRGILFVTKPREGTNPSYYDIALFTSHDSGRTFKQAKLPIGTDNRERSYTILDISDGAVTVNVLFQATNWGNIYTSDANGDNYALNLRYASRTDTNQADFATVKGVDGIYLANVELTPQTPGSDLATRITYDRGGEWFPLAAPESERASCADQTKCNLHLNAQSTTAQPFYSRSKAVGVILGTGNVGEKLTRTNSKTFVSRDAGKTWKTILTGANHFEISQNGGIIVAASRSGATDRIAWSTSDGQDWSECLLSSLGSKKREVSAAVAQDDESPLANRDWTSRSEAESSDYVSHLKKITNLDETQHKREPTAGVVRSILSVPSRDASARFLLHIGTGSYVYLDFNNTESRTCIGWDDPRVPNSDYEVWSPSDLDGDGCLLGSKIIYARKKPQARCWIAHSNPPQVLQEVHCQCFRQDYMCDYCFAPKIDDPSTCVLDCPNYNPELPPADCRGTYMKTKGYRLVAGNRCQGGVDLRGPIETCPAVPPTFVPIVPPPVVIIPPPVAVTPPVVITIPPVQHHEPQTAPTHTAPQQQHQPETAAPLAPQAAPAGKPSHKNIIVAVVASLWAVVLIAGIIGTLAFLSTRNAHVRHSLMRCIPDTWLPAYVPPDREEGPQYHRLQGTGLNANNEDIFNDDEFLQEDANVLEIDD